MRCREQGALLAGAIGTALTMWMLIGGEKHGLQNRPLPLPIANCSEFGFRTTTLVPDGMLLHTNNDTGYQHKPMSPPPAPKSDRFAILHLNNGS